MAKGRGFGRVTGVLGVIGILSIVATYALVTGWNPLPGWADWLENVTVRKLSTPPTSWTVRAGDEPTSATILPQAIIVSTEGSVEARDPVTGARKWSQPDSWAGVAGGTSSDVVLVGRSVGAGFDVYDPASGVRLWGSDDKAGIWPYSNMLLILTCPSGTACTLRSVDPANGKAHWSVALDGPGRPLMGFERATAAIGPVTSAYADSLRAAPPAAPPLIGLPMGGEIHVVSTATGKALHVFAPDTSTRIVVGAHDVISARAELRGSQCFYTETGSDPATGSVRWEHSGYNLRTSSGLGCEQHRDPAGGGDALLGTDTGGRDIVLSASSGKEMFKAKTGEHVVAMDGKVAVIRAADSKSMRAVDLSSGKQLWTTPINRAVSIGVTPDYVLAADPTGAGHLTAYGRKTGTALLSVVSGATVLGISATSLIVNVGRSLGPLPIPPS